MTEEHLPAPLPAEPNPLLMIQKAIESGIPPKDLKDLFDLQCRYEQRQAEQAYADAITAFQSECPPIGKNAMNPHSKKRYADYEGIMRAITPLLRKYRIVVTFDTADDGARMMTTCRVRVGTIEKHTTVTLPVDVASKMMNATQAGGAAMSYGRRYALTAALNIVCTDEDTDALPDEPARAVNAQQQAEIDARLEELSELGVKINLTAFCKWAGSPPPHSLATIPAARLGVIFKDLDGRIATLKQKAAQAKTGGAA